MLNGPGKSPRIGSFHKFLSSVGFAGIEKPHPHPTLTFYQLLRCRTMCPQSVGFQGHSGPFVSALGGIDGRRCAGNGWLCHRLVKEESCGRLLLCQWKDPVQSGENRPSGDFPGAFNIIILGRRQLATSDLMAVASSRPFVVSTQRPWFSLACPILRNTFSSRACVRYNPRLEVTPHGSNSKDP